MSKFTSPLDNVHVAAPCSANWEEMNGDEQARHCGLCQLNVYNLSAMTRHEAEKLLVEREGRLCVRFYRRADGTIITENCPRGIAAIKRRVSRAATAIFSAAFTFMSGVGIFTAFAPKQSVTQGGITIPVETPKIQKNDSTPPQHTMGVMAVQPVQGKVAVKIKPQKNNYILGRSVEKSGER